MNGYLKQKNIHEKCTNNQYERLPKSRFYICNIFN
jgi:hypothetical protein